MGQPLILLIRESTSATIGKVVDMGLSDPFNMGGAMAPAAVDTIQRHLFDLKLEPSYYDLIITGDLAEIGRNTALALFKQKGLVINENQFKDCGLMIYGKDQEVFAGGEWAWLFRNGYVWTSSQSNEKGDLQTDTSCSYRCFALTTFIPAKRNHSVYCTRCWG